MNGALPRGNQYPLAWVSLDEGDNEVARFWNYIIAALQKLVPQVGDNSLALLYSLQPTSIETILTTLLNEVATCPRDFVFVLDDYHVIQAQPIHGGIAFLLEHLPPCMHVVFLSRADPPLPIDRLRGRGQVTDLRSADLRFTEDEATALLNQVMGLDLSGENVTALEALTEGWAVELQLAALSLQRRKDVSEFIADFTGSDRFALHLDAWIHQVETSGLKPFQGFVTTLRNWHDHILNYFRTLEQWLCRRNEQLVERSRSTRSRIRIAVVWYTIRHDRERYPLA